MSLVDLEPLWISKLPKKGLRDDETAHFVVQPFIMSRIDPGSWSI
jgi:hypothetical protein